jgi:phosphate transport system permease protein
MHVPSNGVALMDPLAHSMAPADHRLAQTMRRQRLQDFVFHKITLLFALSVLLVLAGIIGSLSLAAWPAFKAFGFQFLGSTEWDPVKNIYGGFNSIYGTLLTSFIALIIAIPISFGIALFLTELCPTWLKRPLGTAVELLAGVPSIIYGMWGLFVFAPLFGEHLQPLLSATLGEIPLLGKLFQGAPMGIGMLCAGIILSIMVIPFIASVMRDVFEIVPAVLKESAYAVGATTWEVVWNVVLPYTKAGVVGGVMLGLGRALGETMAVTFVIGNANRIDLSLFSAGTSIASTLANEFAEAQDDVHIASLMTLGLLLFVITFIVLTVAKLLLLRLSRNEGART